MNSALFKRAEMFFPFFISFLTALFGLIIQFVFYGNSVSADFLQRSIAEIAVPFFGIGLITVIIREDLITLIERQKSFVEKFILPKKALIIILLVSFLILITSFFQFFSFKSSIQSSLYFFFASLLIIFSANLRVVDKNKTALSINIANLILVCTILISSYKFNANFSLLDCYLISSSFLLIFCILKFGYLKITEDLIEVDQNNLMHNLVFTVTPLIEGIGFSYFAGNDYAHIAIIHRVGVILTGIAVNYIFFYFKDFVRIKDFIASSRYLALVIFLVLLYLGIQAISLKYEIGYRILENMNLSLPRLYLLSFFILSGYIFALASYVIIRQSGGRLFSSNQILLINISYILSLGFLIYFSQSTFLYVQAYLLLWVIFFIICFVRYLYNTKISKPNL